jgi:NAD(P)H-flavin reductase
MPGNHRLFCLQGASRPFEFGYRKELERYAAEVPWFKYVATLSRPWEDPGWPAERGRVDDLLRKYTDCWQLQAETTTGYLCGHPKMIENSRGILARAGWKNDAIREEAYYPAAIKESAAGA